MANISSYPVGAAKLSDTVLASSANNSRQTKQVEIGSIIDIIAINTYQTVADLPTNPIPENGTSAKVANDPILSNDGYWAVSDGSWIQNSSLLPDTIVDTEDIEVAGDGLLLADRDNTSNTLGYKIIRSGFDFNNIPAGYDNSIWEIRSFHDLNGSVVNLPNNVTLSFNGGRFSNGTLNGSSTKIQKEQGWLFNLDVEFTGVRSWASSFTPYMFGAKGDFESNDTLAIQKCINVTASVASKMSMVGNFLSDTITFGDGIVGTSEDNVEIETLCKIQSISDVDMVVVRGVVKHTGSLVLRGTSRLGTSRNIVIKDGAKDSTFDKVYLSNTSLGIDYEAIGNNNIINWNLVECRELSKTYRAGYTKGNQVSNTDIFNIGEITTTEPLFIKTGHIVIRGKAYPIVKKPNTTNVYYVGDFYNMPDWDATDGNKLWHYTGGGILHQKHTDNGAIDYKTVSMLSLDGASFTTQAFYGVTINGGDIEGNATNIVVGGIFMDGETPTTMTCIGNTFTGLHSEANVANQPMVYVTAKSSTTFLGCLMANGIRVSGATAGVKFQSWRGTDRTSNVYLGTGSDFGTVVPTNPDFLVYRDLSTALSVQIDLNDLAPDMEYMGDLRVDYTVKGEINLLNVPAGEIRTIIINAGGSEAPCTINGGSQSIFNVKGEQGKTIIKVILLMKGNNFTHYIEEQTSFKDLVVDSSLTVNGPIVTNENLESHRYNTTESLGGTYITWRDALLAIKGFFGFASVADNDVYLVNNENALVRLGTNGRTDDLVIGLTGDVSAPNGLINTKGYTVATLPTAVAGQRCYVTDASNPTYLGTLVGGGTVRCPVFFTGGAWITA